MPGTDGLDGLRRQIDRIDDRIIDLLAERFALLREVAAYKRPRGIPVVIPERIEEVVERCAARGAQRGLDAQMLRDIYRRVIAEACAVEERAMATLPRRRPIPAASADD